MDYNLQPVERGSVEQDRTHNHWPEHRQIDCERRYRESFEMEDLAEELDDECAVLAREGKALELGLLLVKRTEAKIQRLTNREIYGPSTVELFSGTRQAVASLSIRGKS